MRFFATAGSALLVVSQVAAATINPPKASLAIREALIAPKFFIISMVCSLAKLTFSPI